MPPPKHPAVLPKTKVYWNMITLTDRHPTTKQWYSFTFPRKMTAWPLSLEGPAGSGPNNKAPWWPFFQERHRIGPLYWVQGHMLNDNIHGPGEPKNLVPISNTLNTNMLGIVERFVKKAVNQGKVLYYEVNAHWEGATPQQLFDSSQKTHLINQLGQVQSTAIQAAANAQQIEDAIKFPNRKVPKVSFDNPFTGLTFTPTREMIHPAKVRQDSGGLIADGGDLLWGEQFAPTRLSWVIKESTNWHAAADWSLGSHAMVDLAASWQIRSEDWYNNIPD